MAFDITSYKSVMDWANVFIRTGRFPLDITSLFDNYEDARKYVNGSGDSRGFGVKAYAGQIISVVNDSEENNGIYFVKKIKASSDDSDGILVKVGSGDEELNEVIDCGTY